MKILPYKSSACNAMKLFLFPADVTAVYVVLLLYANGKHSLSESRSKQFQLKSVN
jgi:hypothetical protein